MFFKLGLGIAVVTSSEPHAFKDRHVSHRGLDTFLPTAFHANPCHEYCLDHDPCV
jgi:hypothetical protein